MKKIFLLIIFSGVLYFFYQKKISSDNQVTFEKLIEADSKFKIETTKESIINISLENINPVKDRKKLEKLQKQWDDFQAIALANTQPIQIKESNNFVIKNSNQYSIKQLEAEAMKSIKENKQREETEQIP